MQGKLTIKLLVLLALTLLAVQGRFLQTEGNNSQCCNTCGQNLRNRFFIRPNQFKSDLFYALRQNVSDDGIISILGDYPFEYTSNLLQVMEEVQFRKDLNLMTCATNAGINYHTHPFGEFSNTTVNAIFESIMATLDGNIAGRDSTYTYTLINFLRKIRTSFNQKVVNARSPSGEYARFDSSGTSHYEDAESVAKNYAMSYAGAVMNMMSRDEQETVKTCFNALKNEEQWIGQSQNAYNPHNDLPLDWKVFQNDQNLNSGYMNSHSQNIYAQKYLKFFGRSKNFTATCPRPISIKKIWGTEPNYPGNYGPSSYSSRLLFDDSLLISDDSFLHTIELQRLPAFSYPLTDNYYMEQMSNEMYDSLVYSSYESTSASQVQYFMPESESRVVSKVIANLIGNILSCSRPGLLAKLRNTCPGSCVAC